MKEKSIQKAKKTKKEKIKPNPLVWFIYALYSKLLMFFANHTKYNRKALTKRNKKEGAILLYMHCSNKDHYIVGATAGFRNRLVFVVTKYYMHFPVLNKVLKLIRSIPREQFRSDMVSIRRIKKAVEHKAVVAIAPTGQTSLNGEMTYLDPSIVKLLRLCKVDVYTLQMKGAYLAYPKWRTEKNKRKARIYTSTVKVLTKEEIATLSEEEIYQRVHDSLDLSEHELQLKNPIKVRGKHLIEGLENVLFYCPKCGAKYSYHSDSNTMVCQECHNSVSMNNFGQLYPTNQESIAFENEAKWYHWQGEKIKENLKNESFIQINRFKLYRNLKDSIEMEESGEGTLTLTKNELFYDGTQMGEVIHKEFALESLTQLPFNPLTHFEIPDGEGTFQFRPLDGSATIVEWVQTIDVMNEMKNKNCQSKE